VIPDTTAPIIVSLLAVGMALAFILADRFSPTSQAQAVFLAFVGISIAVDVLWVLPMRRTEGVVSWEGLLAIPQVLAFAFAYEWVLRVRQTIPTRDLNTRGPDRLLRAAQGLAAFYGLTAVVFPELRAAHFGNLALETGEELHPSFWLFSIPLGLSLALGTASHVVHTESPPRPGRRKAPDRVCDQCTNPGGGGHTAGAYRPGVWRGGPAGVVGRIGPIPRDAGPTRPVSFALSVAPGGAELVTRRGLKSATDEKTLEISVVSCDLRGFTAFSAATPSRRVIGILREYYDAVGAAAATCGGTIKDQAGDGVLILVGAPIAFSDHAQRALELAHRIRSVGIALTSRWSNPEMQLGVGVGVASGFATVGVIGGASRLEYTAVGAPVNLASRLCAEASHGEVLVDARTTELAGASLQNGKLHAGQALQLKGFELPMQSYVLQAG
jgi:adenylate cyclase